MTSIVKAYISFLNKGKISMLPIFANFLQKAQDNPKYTIEFLHDNACLIKFPGSSVSLHITLANWDHFTASPAEKQNKIYRMTLVDNATTSECTSRQLGYKINLPKIFGKISSINDEVDRVGSILRTGSIKLDQIDELWSNDYTPIDPETTIERATYVSGKKKVTEMSGTFKIALQTMIDAATKENSELIQNRQKRLDIIKTAYNKREEKEAEARAEEARQEEAKKKARPVLGKLRRIQYKKKVPKRKKLVIPDLITQDFYNMSIVDPHGYLLLVEMTNPDNRRVPTFLVGLQNTPYNMVKTIKVVDETRVVNGVKVVKKVKQYGVEVFVLDPQLRPIEIPGYTMQLRHVASDDKLQELFKTIMDFFVAQELKDRQKD